ncbi:MAG: hypothetical protein EZS28_001693 [Streblomastix strix]|uniref:Uncharacterized protein n=1 Tax=Streblomastix strix TaxID=222440 RepID=A0A5J4X6W5_9EUKA|nr:MAG: hypothetical protein EZS28_001693 [Streblomastix strix]
MRLRLQILNRLLPEEKQRVKRGFGSQMRPTSFYESQVQMKIMDQNNKAILIDTGWDFGSGTGEQQDEFQEELVDESQYLEIRPLNKNNKKHKYMKHKNSVGRSPWSIVQLDELSGTAREGTGPVKHKIKIQTTHQQKSMNSLSNINKPTELDCTLLELDQMLNLNVDLAGMKTNPFIVPKGTMYQLTAYEAAQAHHVPSEILSKNGNIRKVASSTDSIDSSQENLISELKVEKNGDRIFVRNLATCINTSFVTNLNQSEDQQH